MILSALKTAWSGLGEAARWVGPAKAGLAGTYLGGAALSSYALGRYQDYQKAYSGKDTPAVDALRSGIIAGGIINAGLSFIRKDPLSLMFSTPARIGRTLSGERKPLTLKMLGAGVNKRLEGSKFNKPVRGALNFLETASSIYFPISALAASPSHVSNSLVGTAATLGAGGLLGLGAVSYYAFGEAGMAPLGLAAAGLGAGYALGSRVPSTPAAEGNITSFEQGRMSSVSRMNFSTAGLTLALHKNRRVQ